MLDTLKLYRELKDHIPPEAAEKIVQTLGTVYEELRESITRKDFAELQAVVERLAKIQEQSEIHLVAIDRRLEELTNAQNITQENLAQLTQRVDRLTERVDQLAEAQRHTDDNLAQLTQRVDRLTERVDQLAEAQLRTEQEVGRLSREMKSMNKRLGGLSMTVGYGLEDRILPYIRPFARDAFGMVVTVVDRRNLEYSDTEYDEINIYAEGEVDGERCYLIGECKAQPGKKDADRFASKLERAGKFLKGRIFPLLVGYVYTPSVERYIRSTYPNFKLMKSFEFALKYGNLPDGLP